MKPFFSTWTVCSTFRSGFSFRRNLTRPASAVRPLQGPRRSLIVKGIDALQVIDHLVAAAPRAARCTDEGLAIQERDGVVVGENHQVMGVGRFQPGRQLLFVPVGLVGVVGIEKRDPLDLIGDRRDAVQVAEDEASAAAVAAEHDAGARSIEALPHGVDDCGNPRVAMGSPPRRPALEVVFQVRDDELAIGDLLPQKRDLGADVLDVEMPVVAGLDRLADRLLDGVAVGQCVEDQQDRLCGCRLPVDRSRPARRDRAASLRASCPARL